jgi:hypothetical protein
MSSTLTSTVEIYMYTVIKTSLKDCIPGCCKRPDVVHESWSDTMMWGNIYVPVEWVK